MFVGINFVVFTTNLLIAEYAVAVSSLMLAKVAALIVGKAVLVANAMPFLRADLPVAELANVEGAAAEAHPRNMSLADCISHWP